MVLDQNLIVGILALATSIIVGVLNFLYTKRQMKIMESELNVLLKEEEKRRKYEKVIEVIRKTMMVIKNDVDIGYFYIPSLDDIKKDIIKYFHDNKLTEVTLFIDDKELFVTSESYEHILISNVQKFINFLESRSNIKRHIYIDKYNFNSYPNIIEHQSIDLSDPTSSIENLYKAYFMIEPYAHIIDVFDANLLSDLKMQIDNVVNILFTSLFNITEIHFTHDEKADDIFKKLQNAFFGFEKIEAIFNIVKKEICERFSNIQIELFKKI